MSLAEADEAEVLPAAGAAADTSHRRRLVGISTIIVVFTLALALRRPTSLSPSEGALWAEDGQIFIQTWLLASGSLPDSLGLLVEPYAAQLGDVPLSGGFSLVHSGRCSDHAEMSSGVLTCPSGWSLVVGVSRAMDCSEK